MMKAFIKEIEPFVDEVHGTPRGNVIATQSGTDPEAPKVALVAHLDQIGFIVFNVDASGFVRFRKSGTARHPGTTPQFLQKVRRRRWANRAHNICGANHPAVEVYMDRHAAGIS
jgi:putative aminopeptidase FrvX